MISFITQDLKNLLDTLSNETSKKVFWEIVKSRILTKRQLSEQLNGMDLNSISQSLKDLKDIGLIDIKAAAIPDWDKYYITEEGLAAERAFKPAIKLDNYKP